MTRPLVCAFSIGILLAPAAGCRKIDTRKLDPVRAVRDRVELRFEPPADGLLTDAQIDAYLRVRRAAGSGSAAEALRALRIDPAEFVWVRARIIEARQALDSKRVSDAAFDSYTRAIATVRESRRTAKDPKVAARLDGDIAALERERSSLRKADGVTAPIAANSLRVAKRRAEIESVGP